MPFSLSAIIQEIFLPSHFTSFVEENCHSVHQVIIFSPYHISFMGLLAIWNDSKERNLLWKEMLLTLFYFVWKCLLVLNVLRHHNKLVSYMTQSSYSFILFLLCHYLFPVYFSIVIQVVSWVLLNRYQYQFIHWEDGVFWVPVWLPSLWSSFSSLNYY